MDLIGLHLTRNRIYIQKTFQEAGIFFQNQHGRAPLLDKEFMRLADWQSERSSEVSSDLCEDKHDSIIYNLSITRATIDGIEPNSSLVELINDTISLVYLMKKGVEEENERAYEMEGRE